MADENETTNPPETTTVGEENKSGGSSAGDIASILTNYVPRGEHDSILDALNALDEENAELKGKLKAFEGIDPAKLQGRITELEGKVRTRNHRDAFNQVADELEIDPDFRDDVFEMGKWAMDRDEADAKAMKAHYRDWLDARESRKKYLKAKAEEGAPTDGETTAATPQAGDKGPQQPRLHTEDSTGRGGAVAGGKMFRYRSADLSNHEWMKANAQAYARAAAEGRLQKIG